MADVTGMLLQGRDEEALAICNKARTGAPFDGGLDLWETMEPRVFLISRSSGSPTRVAPGRSTSLRNATLTK